jgi:ADP-ribose pyrophosphatase YjhB (NUDIX family)
MFVAEELYSQILKVMPIPCVDLLVTDGAGNVLLLLRKNEPAAGQWWFPGGRVLFGEKRVDAARRKLKEECGIEATQFLHEIGTYELFFDIGQGTSVHSITTLFKAHVERESEIQLDHQSHDASWLQPHEWLQQNLSPFINNSISAFISGVSTKHLK